MPPAEKCNDTVTYADKCLCVALVWDKTCFYLRNSGIMVCSWLDLIDGSPLSMLMKLEAVQQIAV